MCAWFKSCVTLWVFTACQSLSQIPVSWILMLGIIIPTLMQEVSGMIKKNPWAPQPILRHWNTNNHSISNSPAQDTETQMQQMRQTWLLFPDNVAWWRLMEGDLQQTGTQTSKQTDGKCVWKKRSRGRMSIQWFHDSGLGCYSWFSQEERERGPVSRNCISPSLTIMQLNKASLEDTQLKGIFFTLSLFSHMRLRYVNISWILLVISSLP